MRTGKGARVKGTDLLRLWLADHAKERRDEEARCRRGYTPGTALHEACQALAACHAAAALIYETELSRLGPEKP